MDANEQTLLRAAQAGDKSALEKLLSGYLDPVYRFGMKMCRDRHDAEDIAQETLLAAARSMEGFRGASSLGTWLYSIARRACLRRRRRGKHEPETFHRIDEPEHASSLADEKAQAPDEEAARSELSRALQQALSRLDESHREVLVLRDVQGLTAPEVAEVLGISVEAVKSRLHRARQAMREELAPRVDKQPTRPAKPDCPDVLRLLSQRLEQEIDAGLCAEMERHVAGCEHCRGECDALKSVLALCTRHGSEPVPAAVQKRVREAVAAALADGRTTGSPGD